MPFCIHRFDIYVTLTLPARIGFNFELFFSYRRRFFSTGNSLAVMHVPYIDCLVQKFTTTIVIDEINSLLPEAISNESKDAANISNLGKRPSLVNICCVCLYVMKWNRHPIMNTLSFSFALPLSIFRSLARSLGRSVGRSIPQVCVCEYIMRLNWLQGIVCVTCVLLLLRMHSSRWVRLLCMHTMNDTMDEYVFFSQCVLFYMDLQMEHCMPYWQALWFVPRVVCKPLCTLGFAFDPFRHALYVLYMCVHSFFYFSAYHLSEENRIWIGPKVKSVPKTSVFTRYSVEISANWTFLGSMTHSRAALQKIDIFAKRYWVWSERLGCNSFSNCQMDTEKSVSRTQYRLFYSCSLIFSHIYIILLIRLRS